MQKQGIILAIVMLLMVGVGCGAKDASDSADNLTYSNLTDEASQHEVQEALLAAGVKQDNIDSFFRGVDYYNDTVSSDLLTSNGFVTIKGLEPEYDLLALMDQWEAENPDFLGYNCRITSYDLTKGLLAIEQPQTDRADWLIFDTIALEGSPETLFTTRELEEFQTLYASIPTENTKDIAVHVENVQADWQAKGINFSGLGEVALISVIFHNEEDGYLFTGHIGVLVPTTGKQFIYLEKVGLQEPYQAIKFNKRVDLNDYLMNKYDISWRQPMAKPFIMENGALIDDYRENPNNPEGRGGE